jgi:hypothetical protein
MPFQRYKYVKQGLKMFLSLKPNEEKNCGEEVKETSNEER